VYSAAAEPRGLLLDTPDDELVRNVDMNCTVPTPITKALAAEMVKRGSGCSPRVWDELRDSGVDVMGYVIGTTLTPEFRRNRGVTPEIESALRAIGAQRPEECAAHFYEVFGSGPGVRPRRIEAKFAADAQLPRAQVVAAMGEHMQASFG
jgi:short-subunit dehydrogenase